MSEKKIAASTPYRRTGCSVISVTRSGVHAGLEHARRPRGRLRYSGQRAAGLAHEPHRGVRHRLAARACRKALSGGGVGGSSVGHPRNPRRSVGVFAHRDGRAGRPTVGHMVVRQETHPGTGAGASPRSSGRPWRACARARLRPRSSARRCRHRSGSRPTPPRCPPTSPSTSTDVGTGRIILLHDPAGNDAWDGTFRCVAYARAEIDLELVTDPLLAAVGWSWLTEALDAHGATYPAASGTVTRVATESFGGMADEGGTAQLEIRASWTPVGRRPATALDMAPHVEAWGELLCTAVGPAAGARGRHRDAEPRGSGAR